ncbi:Clcn7 [Symbiodinium necroappetens]|uniref:Chloride channel protein n=1 Tax=Symbiodinium necroappetens TaxID=1628268 RepID=A0A812NSX0_9DINO|nr:Clcn7 [Symbiodinium necroappetens]
MRFIGPTGWRRWFEVLVLTFVVSTIKFLVPVVLVDGVGNVFGSVKQTLWWSEQAEGVKAIFHQEMTVSDMAILGTVQFFIACWTYGAGVPSGLFLPSLYLGAAWGKLLGMGFYYAGMLNHISDADKYAFVGSAAALSGLGRITISLSVIVMECTINNQFGVPLFLATMLAKWVGQLFNEGIYDLHLELKHVPLLEPMGGKELLDLRAMDIMAREVKTLPACAPVKQLVGLLQDESHNHHGFPVIDMPSGVFLGLIRRSELLHILERGKKFAFYANRQGTFGAREDLVHPMVYKLSPDEILNQISEEDLDKQVNLIPYMNRAAYTVPHKASVLRCFAIFRSIGLRHLPVLDEQSRIRGMITRKDLLLEHLHEKKWLGRMRGLHGNGCWKASLDVL